MTEPAPRLSRAPLVGRGRELATLTAGLDAALAGRGHLYLISGEPGVGKTRLLEEVAAQAAARDAIVVWGRCWEGDDAPPFWPWVQVLRALIQREEAADPAVADADAVAQVARLVPHAGGQLGDQPGARLPEAVIPLSAAGATGLERFALIDGITGFLRGMAERQLLVLLLDDLHAADPPSLLLLQFLARDLGTSALLVVAAYREAEARGAGPLADHLGDLARASTAIPLRGLDATATRELVTAAAGRDPSDRLVAALHEATGGNPFFLDEVVRLLVAERRFDDAGVRAGRLGIPDRVRSAVRARLASLSPESRAALDVAAVVGQEFDPELLSAVLGDATEELLARLAAPLAAEFVRPGSAGSFQFAHALIRETIYDELPAARRVRLHSQIGAALEARGASRPDSDVSALAHHFLQGQPEADAVRALTYARRAGERALELFAYEDAAALFEQALVLLDRGAAAGAAERAELLLALAGPPRGLATSHGRSRQSTPPRPKHASWIR